MLFRPVKKCEPLWNGDGMPPLIIALHQPNRNPLDSRATFMVVEENVVNGRLELRIDLTRKVW